jgi:hypothetical protein
VDRASVAALTRRASLLSLGMGSLAGLAMPGATSAKKKGKKDDRCKKQVDACQQGIADLCTAVFAEDAGLCIPIFAPCCAHLKECKAAQAFACAVEALESIES